MVLIGEASQMMQAAVSLLDEPIQASFCASNWLASPINGSNASVLSPVPIAVPSLGATLLVVVHRRPPAGRGPFGPHNGGLAGDRAGDVSGKKPRESSMGAARPGADVVVILLALEAALRARRAGRRRRCNSGRDRQC